MARQVQSQREEGLRGGRTEEMKGEKGCRNGRFSCSKQRAFSNSLCPPCTLILYHQKQGDNLQTLEGRTFHHKTYLDPQLKYKVCLALGR